MGASGFVTIAEGYNASNAFENAKRNGYRAANGFDYSIYETFGYSDELDRIGPNKSITDYEFKKVMGISKQAKITDKYIAKLYDRFYDDNDVVDLYKNEVKYYNLGSVGYDVISIKKSSEKTYTCFYGSCYDKTREFKTYEAALEYARKVDGYKIAETSKTFDIIKTRKRTASKTKESREVKMYLFVGLVRE